MKYLFLVFLSWNLWAQDPLPEPDLSVEDSSVPTVKKGVQSTADLLNDRNVIIKYKSEEYFDFDALRVEGDIITPADLTTRSNKRVRFNVKDHVRKDFDDFIREDLIDIH